jgi:cellulose synthase/poly-beta-1,6-N-acetylglucosamine synthase-like glycosyltransferase
MEWLPSNENLLAWVLLTGLFSMACIQLFWVLWFHFRLVLHKEKQVDYLPPVSVIIAARNEEDNLFKNLPFILEQDYPEFEVIVINHQSKDESQHILKAMAKEYDRLKVINLEPNKHLKTGKKLPLTIAIKGARHNHLLFTDADCQPKSNDWIKNMGNSFKNKELVLGYGPYRKEKGMLNRLIRLDTAMIGLSYLSMALGRAPYMGVGRNMGYTKDLFFKNDGFKSHYALQSGDDDLFVQENARKKNYSVCLVEDAFMYSEGEKSFTDWIKQKGRHFTTTGYYKVFKKLLLGIYPLSLILMHSFFISLVFIKEFFWSAMLVFGLIILFKWIISGLALHKMKETWIAFIFPFWDLFYAFLAPLMYYTVDKSTERKWR